MNDPVYCPDCDGEGYIDGGECSNCGIKCEMCGDDCATCNGSGYVPNPDLPTSTPEDPNNEETIK